MTTSRIRLLLSGTDINYVEISSSRLHREGVGGGDRGRRGEGSENGSRKGSTKEGRKEMRDKVRDEEIWDVRMG
jgi:hypothetical protein